jgi:hypothetical protein
MQRSNNTRSDNLHYQAMPGLFELPYARQHTNRQSRRYFTAVKLQQYTLNSRFLSNESRKIPQIVISWPKEITSSSSVTSVKWLLIKWQLRPLINVFSRLTSSCKWRHSFETYWPLSTWTKCYKCGFICIKLTLAWLHNKQTHHKSIMTFQSFALQP